MNNEHPVGFWSYTHRDDELDDGRIRRLAQSIGDEFEIITGEELKVFVDKKSIEWGDGWRIRIDTALTSSTFLIPIITPRYFKSQQCRREIITFAGHAASLGLDELLLPIHYVNVPELTDNKDEDEVIALIRKRQWVDWRELRLEDEKSPEYRKAINQLAARLSKILEESASVEAPPPVDLASEDDGPGFVEIMATAEAAMPRWVETLQSLTDVMTLVGSEMNWASQSFTESDSRNAGFAGRLRISQELAKRLDGPAQEMLTLGSKYSTELIDIDPAIISIIRYAAENKLNKEDKQSFREFFEILAGLIAATRANAPHMQAFAEGARSTAQSSRYIRPVMNILQAAIQHVIDGQTIIEEWDRLLKDVDDDPESPDEDVDE
ncbi:toll/interleukin-1 receptor domain-containing protein [Embleya hyalina]|nr:toll/interleukin-1 receptor domain-containing protein [Embleya hyalina]